jgi:hypothetical protein
MAGCWAGPCSSVDFGFHHLETQFAYYHVVSRRFTSYHVVSRRITSFHVESFEQNKIQ